MIQIKLVGYYFTGLVRPTPERASTCAVVLRGPLILYVIVPDTDTDCGELQREGVKLLTIAEFESEYTFMDRPAHWRNE